MADFSRFGGVLDRCGCFVLLVEHVIAAEPDGACEGVEGFECEVDVVVAAFDVWLGVI